MVLAQIDGHLGSDYINASYIDVSCCLILYVLKLCLGIALRQHIVSPMAEIILNDVGI